jgi:hypothetical protein
LKAHFINQGLLKTSDDFMRKGQGAFEYMLLLAGILAIALVAFFMLRGTNQTSKNQLDFAQCAGKLATASVCYDGSGAWKADTITTYSAADYGLPVACTTSSGGLANTSWDDPLTEDRFVCGNRPPQ